MKQKYPHINIAITNFFIHLNTVWLFALLEELVLHPVKKEEMEKFIDAYIKAVGNRFKTDMIREHTHAFIPITCLRGITWCAMAWVQYQQPDKLIFNESTFKKLNAYLDMDFLKNIRGYLEP